VPRSTTILIGIASVLLLTWVTLILRLEAIESDLVQRAGQALAAYSITELDIQADGRDLFLSGEISSKIAPGYVSDVVRGVWGVRAVDIAGLRQRTSLLDKDDPLNPRFDGPKIVRLGGNLSNPMNAGTCQRTMARLAEANSVRFETDGASPMSESYQLLNDLAAVAYQCPHTRIVIGGHTDDSDGDRELKLRLSLARAEAVAQFFNLAGIDAERMQIIGYGDSQPIASNASAEGRAANRRITFDVLPIQ
jgi:outer membrane protein OmpA-like peptidoglycan-associated protein